MNRESRYASYWNEIQSLTTRSTPYCWILSWYWFLGNIISTDTTTMKSPFFRRKYWYNRLDNCETNFPIYIYNYQYALYTSFSSIFSLSKIITVPLSCDNSSYAMINPPNFTWFWIYSLFHFTNASLQPTIHISF